jgi:hypothetical protein
VVITDHTLFPNEASYLNHYELRNRKSSGETRGPPRTTPGKKVERQGWRQGGRKANRRSPRRIGK